MVIISGIHDEDNDIFSTITIQSISTKQVCTYTTAFKPLTCTTTDLTNPHFPSSERLSVCEQAAPAAILDHVPRSPSLLLQVYTVLVQGLTRFMRFRHLPG